MTLLVNLKYIWHKGATQSDQDAGCDRWLLTRFAPADTTKVNITDQLSDYHKT